MNPPSTITDTAELNARQNGCEYYELLWVPGVDMIALRVTQHTDDDELVAWLTQIPNKFAADAFAHPWAYIDPERDLLPA